MKPQLSKIICIGNGKIEADYLARNIAKTYNLDYKGCLGATTDIRNGCYHTSIYDIKLLELVSKIKSFTDLKVIMLDQDATHYQNSREFFDTIDLGENLVDYADVEFVNPTMHNPFIHIVKTNKSFCMLPFNTVRGDKKHCCWMSPFDQAFSDFYNNSDSNKMRKKMLLGQPVKECFHCYNIESTGAISERQHQTIQWSHKLKLRSLSDVKNLKLTNYEISVGNKCNLMCRMCNSYNSNLISEEYFRLGFDSTNGQIISADDFGIVDIDSVQRIQVAGGEPSISVEFYNFLKKCIDHKKTNFEIFVSTNCVAINKEFTQLIKHFNNIQFGISVDGFDTTNQYIRWPLTWSKLINNINKLISVLKPHNYYFNTTVSIYNISRLYELFEFLETNYPTSTFNISFLSEPKILQPWNFPDKDLALKNLKKIKSLRSYQQNTIFKSKIDGLIKGVESSVIDFAKLQEFFEFNDKLDLSRDVKLINFIPELDRFRAVASS